MKPKVFHVITKLELGGAQRVTLMTLERLPRDRTMAAKLAGVPYVFHTAHGFGFNDFQWRIVRELPIVAIVGMANSTLKLIEHPRLRCEMGRRGRVMEFDIGTSVDIVESTYRDYLGTIP